MLKEAKENYRDLKVFLVIRDSDRMEKIKKYGEERNIDYKEMGCL